MEKEEWTYTEEGVIYYSPQYIKHLSFKFTDRIVTSLPLQEIWDDTQIIATERGCSLTQDAIKEALQKDQVKFVIANIGEKLNFVSGDQCYRFWREDVKQHLVKDATSVNLENYPKNYAYLASEWKVDDEVRLFLLEKIH